MVQFVAFDKNTQVSGEVILSTINSFPENLRALIDRWVSENNIDNPRPNTWFNQQSWLNVLKEISAEFGKSTLIETGISIPENITFPPEAIDLESALHSIDVAYHANHRNGRIGYYKLLSFRDQDHQAVVECNTPYPCHFDRGILTALSRKFLPLTARMVDVQLDKNQRSRLDGADASFYIITWV